MAKLMERVKTVGVIGVLLLTVFGGTIVAYARSLAESQQTTLTRIQVHDLEITRIKEDLRDEKRAVRDLLKEIKASIEALREKQ